MARRPSLWHVQFRRVREFRRTSENSSSATEDREWCVLQTRLDFAAERRGATGHACSLVP